MIRSVIILIVILSSNVSPLGFKFQIGLTSQFTTYHRAGARHLQDILNLFGIVLS